MIRKSYEAELVASRLEDHPDLFFAVFEIVNEGRWLFTHVTKYGTFTMGLKEAKTLCEKYEIDALVCCHASSVTDTLLKILQVELKWPDSQRVRLEYNEGDDFINLWIVEGDDDEVPN